ncbi:MAG: uridine kinase [Clostridia bacterium]|nr:uridine kinase [Clostridia bacterium]
MSYIIGIAGGSGSGKSTFAKRIRDCFKENVSLITCDNYYLAHDDISLGQRKKLNYDSPEAFEFSLMVRQLKELRDGKDIDSPVYDFTLHTRSSDTLHIEAKPVIIVDGILIFSQKELRDMMDMKIYVETDADERILRRVRRDTVERGRDIDGIIDQYLSTVKPMHNAYVEPTKAFADIIINGGKNNIAFDIVKTKIEKLLQTIGG